MSTACLRLACAASRPSRCGPSGGPATIPVFYMRHATETAPRDGEVVILQDDASGTYDVAHWSAEAGEWVGENGEASKIAPIHWHPMPSAKFLLQEDKGSSNPSPVRPSAWWRDYNFIVDVVSAAALIGLFFYVIQDA